MLNFGFTEFSEVCALRRLRARSSEVVCALRLRKLMRKLGFGPKRWAASMPSLATRSFLTYCQASRPGDDTLSGGAHLNYESIW
jgi:hypothetical protein